MEHNPYAPPESVLRSLELDSEQQHPAKTRLTQLAFVLFLLATLQGVIQIVALSSELASLSHRGFRLDDLVVCAVMMILLVGAGVIGVGALKMMTFSSYSWATMGAFLACTPVVSPLFVVGIPFGVWAFVVLSSPEVESAFQPPKKPLTRSDG